MGVFQRASLGLVAAIATLSAWQADAQSDLDRCTAATPQFPQACPCVIDRAQASGITGSTLSRLLSNDTGGLPIDTFQRYGAIYVQCIQEAVLAGPPALPQGAPPIPAPVTPPAPTVAGPTPAPQSAQPQDAVAITGLGYPQSGRAPMVLRLDAPRPAGLWGNAFLDRSGAGSLLAGVHYGNGHLLAVECRPPYLTRRTAMLLGGVPHLEQSLWVNIRVTRADGADVAQGSVPALPVEGPFLLLPLNQRFADALRAGAEVAFSADGLPPIRFGLDGSARAIPAGNCGTAAFRPEAYTATEDYVPNVGWSLAATPAPVLAYGAGSPNIPDLSLTCDRRLLLRSQVIHYATPFE